MMFLFNDAKGLIVRWGLPVYKSGLVAFLSSARQEGLNPVGIEIFEDPHVKSVNVFFEVNDVYRKLMDEALASFEERIKDLH